MTGRASVGQGTEDESVTDAAIVRACFGRAEAGLEEAQRLLDQDFPSVAFVWAIRSAELFMRTAVLGPLHVLDDGMSWSEVWELSMQGKEPLLGSAGTGDVGKKGWRKAIDEAKKRWGIPAGDEPLLDDGSSGWDFLITLVRRRGHLVHGNAVPEASTDEAREVIDFIRFLNKWWVLRLVTSPEDHPLTQEIRGAISRLRAEFQQGAEQR